MSRSQTEQIIPFQESAMTLTAKQERFVEEYLIDLNATQAAIRAGYSQKTAAAVGHENLRKPKIAEIIAQRQKARSERVQIDADWVLKRLADEVEADLADLYEEGGGLKPVQEWPEIWRKGLVAGVEVEETTVEGASVGRVKKIRLSDRIRRIELIGKHVEVQAFRDQVEHKGGISLNVTQDDAEL
jgi:phage terminase small subunit